MMDVRVAVHKQIMNHPLDYEAFVHDQGSLPSVWGGDVTLQAVRVCQLTPDIAELDWTLTSVLKYPAYDLGPETILKVSRTQDQCVNVNLFNA